MVLTHENYFSPATMENYMSYSQFCAFEECEAMALAELNGDYEKDFEYYKEGHFFEACITDKADDFLLLNGDMISSRGVTKGEVKSNYKCVIESATALLRQPLFKEILDKCERQVIMSGEIAGLKFKGCVDFFDPLTGNCYDTKCMKNFKRVFSENERSYIGWYFAYGYHYQAAIYRELVRQNYNKIGRQHIIAATKEEVPDVSAISFTDEILDNALDIIKEYALRYDAVKRGEVAPERCEKCDYCKQTKNLKDFEIVGEFE